MRHFTLGDYDFPAIPMFAPCGRWLYFWAGATVGAWDLSSGSSEVAWHRTDAFPFRVIVSPCGRYLTGADDRCVVIWDAVKRGEPKWLLANPSGDHISDVAFTPDGKGLLTACIDGRGGVRHWSAGNWKRRPAFATRANCEGALAVSPDGRTVATADVGRKGEGMRLKLWRYPQGTHRKTSKQPVGAIDRLTYSPDGRLIAARDNWRRLCAWAAGTLAPVAEYTPRCAKKMTEPVHSFAFHPSGRFLAVTGQAGAVEFVDASTWRPVRTFDWKLGWCYGVAFSADGALAAVGSRKGVVVWDVDL